MSSQASTATATGAAAGGRDGLPEPPREVGTPGDARRSRGLVALYTANGISGLGTRMSFLAVPWFVLASTGRAVDAGVVAFAEMAPYVAVQALGGPVVDRLGLRRSSIGTDLVAAVTVGLVPVLYVLHALPLAVLALLLAVAGAARGAGNTARYVLVPVLAEASGTPLERAAGLADGVSRLAGLAGAPAAGVLISVTSPLLVLAVDAVTFAVSAAVVAAGTGPLPVRADAADAADAAAESPPAGYWDELRGGLQFLRSDRLLLGIAAMLLVTNTLDQAQASVLTPAWATRVVGSPVAFGLVAGGFSAGAVAGNLLLSWLGPRLPRRLTYAVGFLLAGAPRYLAMSLCATVSPVLVVAVVAGVGAGGLNPALGAVEYERVPRPLQPRVLGVLGATAWAGIPLGSLSGGWFVDHAGLRPTLDVAAGLYLLTTLAPFVFPAWRGMDRAAPPRDEG